MAFRQSGPSFPATCGHAWRLGRRLAPLQKCARVAGNGHAPDGVYPFSNCRPLVHIAYFRTGLHGTVEEVMTIARLRITTIEIGRASCRERRQTIGVTGM